MRVLAVVVVALCLAWGAWLSRTPPVPAAVDAAGRPVACRAPRAVSLAAPLQSTDAPMPPFRLAAFDVVPRAAFAVDATVLSTRRYRTGPESRVSPLDLALGWGPMADPAIHGALSIRQSGRWYHYRWGPEGPPIPVADIVRHSSNMHMIPATPAVADRLLDIEAGERVALRGWLVDLSLPGGGRWSTSLRRDDSGAGACEIVYVCEVAVAP